MHHLIRKETKTINPSLDNIKSLIQHRELLEVILAQGSFLGTKEQALRLSQRLVCRDGELLKALIPPSLLQGQHRLGVQFMLTFALRSRASELAYHLHLLAKPQLINENLTIDVSQDLLDELGEAVKIHGPPDHYPILGLNPVGLFLEWRRPYLCHHMDGYQVESCPEKTEEAFCQSHQRDHWWSGINQPLSSMATMLSFYHDETNFYSYDEGQLRELLAKFWMNFKDWHLNTNPIQLDEAMSEFAIKDLNSLQQIGLKGLKNLYYKKTMECHPDRGGSSQDFLKLKENYCRLKYHLESSLNDSRG